MQYNDQQRRVADHRDGAMIVLAGAGSGKTEMVCARAAAMVQEGVCAPEDHLVLTFSRKAAGEMRSRYARHLEEIGYPVDPGRLTVETYHAFGYRMIRDHPEIAHRRDGITLQDDTDQKKMVRALAKRANYDPTAISGQLKSWFSLYSLAKNYGLCAIESDDIPHIKKILKNSHNVYESDIPNVLSLYQDYENDMQRFNVVDFDDLCLWPAWALHNNADLRSQYGSRYPYLTVDEAQDTNVVQYQTVRNIGQSHGNVVMVGDDDQSIYGWRGAYPENMQQFIKHFDPVKAPLERNYRSTSSIVHAASTHIKNNESRLPKSPYSSREDGEKPVIQAYTTGYKMADTIADDIKQQIDNGVPPEEIAVLYRTNRMARVVETGLRNAGVPYKIVGGHSLYDAPEIKAAIAGARLLVNGDDRAAWERIQQYIPGFGAKTLENLFDTADQNDGLNVFGAALMAGGKTAKIAERLDEKLTKLAEYGPSAAGQWLLDPEGMNFEAVLEKREQKSEDAKQDANRRRGNLRTLDETTARAIQMRGAESDQSGSQAERFRVLLESQLSEAADGADTGEKSQGEVVLSTIHRAKGLEWSQVHVAGYSEGLIPLSTKNGGAENKQHLAEERRLSYTALTRAAHRCVLHHPHSIQYPGSESIQLQPSRFLEELQMEPPSVDPDPHRNDVPDPDDEFLDMEETGF